jgi:hypothetical protein
VAGLALVISSLRRKIPKAPSAGGAAWSIGQLGTILHERSQPLVSYFCMSVDAAAGVCAQGAQRQVSGRAGSAF